MSTYTQSIIRNILTELDNPNFVHQDSKYKFIGWNTSRDEANKGIALDNYSTSVIVDKTISTLNLYAVWKVRDIIVTYGDLTVTGKNVQFDDATTNITYTIPSISSYEGLSTEIGREILTNAYPIEVNIAEGFNGIDGSEIATSARKVKVSYTHPESGKTASTIITQYGYTPTYKINCVDNARGKIECYQNSKLLTPISSNGNIKTYSSTSKQFQLKAIPNGFSELKWVAKDTCAYYNLNYAKQLTHSAVYPNSNRCGYWEGVDSSVYKFTSWTGNSIDKSTLSSVIVSGTTLNAPTFEANFNLTTLSSKLVIGDWLKTWRIPYTYTVREYVKKERQQWHVACTSGRKCEGRAGHGWYETEYYYNLENVEKIGYHYYTNEYQTKYKPTNVTAPYSIVIPEDGVLKIKGMYGPRVYSHRPYNLSRTCIGEFIIVRDVSNDITKNQNGIYKELVAQFNSNFTNTDKEFYIEINVKKGEIYQITNGSSSIGTKKIAVFIDTIELDDTPNLKAIENSNTSVVISTIPFCIDDLADDNTNKLKLLNIYNSGTITDHSIRVVKAKAMKSNKADLPVKNITFKSDNNKQTVLFVSIAGHHGWGYSQDLSAVYGNKTIKEIIAKTNTNDNIRGDLSDKAFYLYLPPNTTIKIHASWSHVDTYNFDVWLTLKAVTF